MIIEFSGAIPQIVLDGMNVFLTGVISSDPSDKDYRAQLLQVLKVRGFRRPLPLTRYNTKQLHRWVREL